MKEYKQKKGMKNFIRNLLVKIPDYLIEKYNLDEKDLLERYFNRGVTQMTTETEKRFYESFDIEPTLEYKNVLCIKFIGDTGICDVSEEVCNPIKCNDYTPDKHSKCWENAIKVYPPITDRVLLELICVAFNQVQNIKIYRILTVESLKELILQKLIIFKSDVYREVRKIMGVE